MLCGRNPGRVRDLVKWVRSQRDVEVREAADPDDAVRGADVVVTVTNSTAPLFALDSLNENVHATAVGADSPGKRELPPALLQNAALTVVDSLDQSTRLGELQGIEVSPVSELTTLVHLVTRPRARAGGRTVADLSGLGLQDTTIAAAAVAQMS